MSANKMGKKSSENKLKRLQRKEERARIAASQAVVDKANKQEDPLERFVAFKRFEKKGLIVTLECKRVTSLDEATINWIWELEKKNMKSFYETCDWGWSDKIKREEMTDERAWYLIARTLEPECKPVAFSHFRFDMDYDLEVLYCYELQLEEEVRRKGLGKFMMQVIELIGFSAQMRKIVLTVLKNNPAGVAFFSSLKYTTDDTSPQDNLIEQFSYEIISKENKKLAASN